MIKRQIKKQAQGFFETVKRQAVQASPRKFARTAIRQLAGVDSSAEGVEDKSGETQTEKSVDFKEMLGQAKVSGKQLVQLKTQDAVKRRAGINKIRTQLSRIKIERYRQIQEKILTEGKEKEQEIRVYEAGKPGASETLEEKKEMIEEQRKDREKEEKKEGKALLPKSISKRPKLGIFVKQKKGTGEVRLGKQG